jgi:hypothetical protein
MSKQRYENKTFYDPGRFRYPVTFLQEIVDTQSDGSMIVSYQQILSTRAIREAVTRRFSTFGSLTLEAGVSLMNDYWYFTIRFVRSGFVPVKDMLLSTPDGIYTVNSMPELDEPPNYWKLLCVKTDKAITT